MLVKPVASIKLSISERLGIDCRHRD